MKEGAPPGSRNARGSRGRGTGALDRDDAAHDHAGEGQPANAGCGAHIELLTGHAVVESKHARPRGRAEAAGEDPQAFGTMERVAAWFEPRQPPTPRSRGSRTRSSTPRWTRTGLPAMGAEALPWRRRPLTNNRPSSGRHALPSRPSRGGVVHVHAREDRGLGRVPVQAGSVANGPPTPVIRDVERDVLSVGERLTLAGRRRHTFQLARSS
jgi:hypothetical protein